MEPLWIQHDPAYPRLSPPGCGWDRWSCTWAIASAHRRWQGRLATPRSLPSRGVGSWAWHQSGAWKTGVHNKNWRVSRVYLHFGDGFPGFPWNKKDFHVFFVFFFHVAVITCYNCSCLRVESPAPGGSFEWQLQGTHLCAQRGKHLAHLRWRWAQSDVLLMRF